MKKEEKPAKENVFQILFDRLTSGYYPIGTKIKEQTFSNEFKISRTPIRDILYQLATLQLIEIKPNQSAEVLGLSYDDVEEMYDLRIVLEDYALTLAIKNLRLHNLATLKSNFESITEDTPLDKIAAYDYALHSYIAEASGNKRLNLILEQLFILSIRTTSFPLLSRIPENKSEHLQIIESLFNRNIEQARLLLKEHLKKSKINAVEYLFNQT